MQKEVLAKGGSGPSTTLASAPLRLQFIDANRSSTFVAGKTASLKSNYFIGDDPSRHLVDIPNYESVTYRSLYPGVDLLLYGNQGQLEYDLVLAPRVASDKIRFRLAGAKKLRVSEQGDLLAATALGDVVFQKPVAYQDIDGTRVTVAANYVIGKDRSVRFQLGQYDADKALVIDPVVSYSSLLWGVARAVATDAAGNTYIAGSTNLAELPIVSGYQTALAGTSDAYVVKLDPTGTKALYATYLGGRPASTWAGLIAVDGAGNAYISGYTNASSFPLTTGAYRTTAANYFVTKFNAAGNALAYSTYFSANEINAIAVDGNGSAYLAAGGVITTTANAFQRSASGTSPPFIVKFNAAGTALSYATYLGNGGSDMARALAVDSAGNAYIAGKTKSATFPTKNAIQPALSGVSDAFVTKLNPTGTALVYSTFLGGLEDDSANGIAVHSSGEAVVVGQTGSGDFPVTAGAFQTRKGYVGMAVTNGFVTKLSADGAALAYSSFLGGSFCSSCASASYDNDKATAVAVDAAGYAYVGGRAKSPAFPAAFPMQDTSYGAGNGSDAWPFLAKVNPEGNQLAYSILIGEHNGNDKSILGLAVDPMGNVHAVGDLAGGNTATHPTTAGAWFTNFPNTSGGRFLFKLGVEKYTTFVDSSANPASGSEPITLTATLRGVKGSGGTVTFMDGSTTLGTVAPTGSTATLNVSLAPGVHRITAIHSADSKASQPLFQVVNVLITN